MPRSQDPNKPSYSSPVDIGTIAPDPIPAGVRPQEFVTGEIRPEEPNWSADPNPRDGETRGSGSDLNSDTSRLSVTENFYDKENEDSFPASDPPSNSPLRAAGRSLPANFKDNPRAQFEFGRRSERSTEHVDPTSTRLERGNPDVGEVDLSTIEADKPAQPDRDF